MTKKQIEKKAKEIVSRFVPNEDDDEFLPPFYAQNAAICMAEWALSHQWMSVEDKLPPKGEIVIAHYGNFSSVGLTFACWDGKGWMQEEKDVTHWMPIPPLVEEGGLL